MKERWKQWEWLSLPLLFVFGTVLLCWRAQFGYSFDDEPFIVTLAQRLYYGDTLCIDEWNLAQNAGVLLLPFYRLYMLLFGTTEGILLCFRYVFCVLWAGMSTTVFAVLRKNYCSAIVVYAYLLLFSPLDQMVLSYSTISFWGCTLIACLVYYHAAIRPLKSGVFAMLFSVLSIITVLAIPYMAVAYAAFIVGCLVYGAVRRGDTAVWARRVALISLGIVGVAVVLYACRFCFSRYTVAEFFERLPYMFETSKRFGEASQKAAKHIGLLFEWWPFYSTVIAAVIGCSFLPFFKRSLARRGMLFVTAAFCFLLELLYLELDCGNQRFNLQMVPIVLLGFAAWFLLSSSARPKALFTVFFGIGAVYSFAYQLSSNTELKALATGLGLCGVAAIVCIELFVKEWFAASKTKPLWIRWAAGLGAVALFVCQIALQVSLRIERQYFDAPLYCMTETIEEGAAKGLKTIPWHKQVYTHDLHSNAELLKHVDRDSEQEILFMSLVWDPIQFLDIDLRVGAYSTWNYTKISDVEAFIEKATRYYRVNPQKIPNVILFEEEDRELLDALGMDTSRYVLFCEQDRYLLVEPSLAVVDTE